MHIRDFAKSQPDKAAVIMASTGEVITYQQLDERSNQVAQFLRAQGLKIGDHIAFFLENNNRFHELCWGAQRAGLYYTAISSRLSAEEAAYIINDCGAELFITSTYLEKTATEIKPLLRTVRQCLMMNGTTEGFSSYEQETERYPITPLEDECEGADMLYSSGTTGRPKGVKPVEIGNPIGSEDNLYNILKALYSFDNDVVYLSPAPLYHAAPLRYNMRVQRFGGTCVIMEKFDPETYLELVQKYKITHTQLVPTMFVRMLKLPEEIRNQYDVSSLKVAIHAAAPCPEKIKRQMLEWWGPIIYEYYGGTEGNGYCTTGPQEWLEHPGTVGKAVIGVIHIVNDFGQELPPNETGTIYFSDGKDFEYHNDPEKTAESYNEKGWSTLGDIGYLDEDGYLYLTDRKSFMIISGGVNIYPQEIEDHLINHPAVYDVAVFGIPNADFGEEVKAVVQPVNMSIANDRLAEELITYCRDHLSPIKCPKSLNFMEQLPRHPTGKLYKRLLRDRYWKDHESKII
ncbi:AMP-binding protein [Sneathiella glossodoripedis]|uniref:AMP-binding protein n=1 Tax=Sneathiella glossodoripedis TaxID=418853 RepID=UPI00046EDE44|nr:AMP-binding protein [Sneathiella glossodoripedis]